jgi:signal transduction histidine kinase/PAS domain-containing protein
MAGPVHAIADVAARVLLQAGTLDEAMAEILRALSVGLDWPLAIYWMADDSGALRCRAVWADESMTRAEIVEASRGATITPGDGPVGHAKARGEPVWNDRLVTDTSPRAQLAVAAGLKTVAAFPLADGDEVPAVIEIYARDARPADDRTLALMATLSDQIGQVRRRMNAHEAALEALERARDEMSAVLAALPDAITVKDAVGRLIYANDAAARTAGFATVGEMMRAPVEDVLQRFQLWDEDGGRLQPQDLPSRLALRGGRSQRLVRYRSGDQAGHTSSDRWASVEAVPLTNARGEVQRVVTIIHDVTERRRGADWRRFLGDASTALGASMDIEAVMQSVAELATRSIADCCAIVAYARGGRGAPAGDAGRAAPGAINMLAFASAGQGHPGLDAVAHACAAALVGGDKPILIDTTGPEPPSFLHGAESFGIRSLLAVPLIQRGQPIGMIVLASMTETHAYQASDLSAAAELGHRASATIDNVRLYDEAQEALRAREDLLAIVSHDLRNPLGVVLASSALLLKSSLPPEKEERARRQVEAIQRAGNRMNRLIKDLLDFASIQGGRLSVNPRVQRAGDIVTEVLEALEPLAAPKGLRLTHETAADLQVSCDHDRVVQLFSNVVGNAIKFSPDGATIVVSAAPDGKLVRFAVADAGPGIPPDELPHVFDRYYQAQRKNRDGIGLGLAIARGIAEAHGGRIWVESPVPASGTPEAPGSVFYFTLPGATD